MSQSPPAEAKKGSGKLVIIIVAVVVLLGGGGGAYWFLGRSTAAAAEETETTTTEHKKPEKKKKHAEPEEPPGIVAFDPFIVNLADGGGSRFLRLTLKLVVPGEETAKELEEDDVTRSRVRSAMLELLTQQTAESLITPEGKAELKTQIAEQASHAMHDTEVLDVLFSEFVVQF